MENPSTDVEQNSSPATEIQLPVEPTVTTEPVETPKGSQTPSENLYAALAEERRLRREAEDKLNQLTVTVPDTEMSDEGRELRNEINVLKDKIELRELQETFPQLKDMTPEFQEFRKEYPRHKAENIAKLFLTEKGLLETPRQGLEKPTGGPKVPVSTDLSVDEVTKLRTTDYKKYTEMLRKGQIKI